MLFDQRIGLIEATEGTGVAPYTESISFCLTFFCLQRIIFIKVDVPLRGVRKRQRHLKLLDL